MGSIWNTQQLDLYPGSNIENTRTVNNTHLQKVKEEAILGSFLEFLADRKVLQVEAEEESHFLHYQSDTLQNCAVMASNVTRQDSAVALKEEEEEEGAYLVADLQGTMVVAQVVELNLEVEGGELEIMVVKGVETGVP